MEGLEGLSTTEQAWLHPLDHHRKQDPGFYETSRLRECWRGECHCQVQCYPLKTRDCKDWEMLASKERERSLEGKEAGNTIYQTRLVTDCKSQFV